MPTAETPLAMAERHIVEGQERITRQKATIARLADLGQDTSLAESILREMERGLELAQKHREYLRRQARAYDAFSMSRT